MPHYSQHVPPAVMPFENYSQLVSKNIVPYEHLFNFRLRDQFVDFAMHWFKYKKPMTTGQMWKKFGWDNPSSHSQFAKLAYFKVVRKLGNARRGGKTDLYVLTVLGEEFFRGEKPVYDRVATLEGEVIPMSHGLWHDHHVGKKPELKFIFEMDEHPKSREQWAEERSLALGHG